jgi:hypothetical protein
MNGIPIRGQGNHHMLKRGPSDQRITEAEALDIHYHDTTEQSLKRMKTAGFVVFKSLLSPEELDGMRRLMDETGGDDEAHYRQGHYGKTENDPDFRSFNKHIGQPFLLHKNFMGIVSRQPAIEVIEGIHGYGTRLIGGSIWITGSGRYPMGLHIDYLPFALPEHVASDPRVDIPIMISTLHYYLDDLTIELGPTLVVEGSHKSGRVPDEDTGWNGNLCRALVCKAGDALLFRSDLWHGALPNTSQQRRYMLQVHYGCAYIERTFSSPFKKQSDFPPDILAGCDERQRRLLGERQEGFPVPQGSYILRQGLQHFHEDRQWHQK